MLDQHWHIALLDLSPETCGRLSDTLRKLGAGLRTRLDDADLIFCDSRSPKLISLLSGPASNRTVVVDHDAQARPESTWLWFLEQGAADYLPDSFEPAEVRWILEAHQPQQQAAAHA